MTDQWIELVGEMPSPGYLKYGSQILRFKENPAQGFRRVEMLKSGYYADKCSRYFNGTVRVYNPDDPEIIEENIRRMVLRDREKWLTYLHLEHPEDYEWRESTMGVFKWAKKRVQKPVKPELPPVPEIPVDPEPLVDEEPTVGGTGEPNNSDEDEMEPFNDTEDDGDSVDSEGAAEETPDAENEMNRADA